MSMNVLPMSQAGGPRYTLHHLPPVPPPPLSSQSPVDSQVFGNDIPAAALPPPASSNSSTVEEELDAGLRDLLNLMSNFVATTEVQRSESSRRLQAYEERQQQLNDMFKAIIQYGEAQGDLQNKLSAMSHERASLASSLETERRQREKLGEKCHQLATELVAAVGNNELLENELSAAESRLEDRTTEYNAALTENARLVHEVAGLQSALREMKEQPAVSHLSRPGTPSATSVEQLAAEKADLESRLRDAEEAAAAAEQQHRETVAELAEARNELARLEKTKPASTSRKGHTVPFHAYIVDCPPSDKRPTPSGVHRGGATPHTTTAGGEETCDTEGPVVVPMTARPTSQSTVDDSEYAREVRELRKSLDRLKTEAPMQDELRKLREALDHKLHHEPLKEELRELHKVIEATSKSKAQPLLLELQEIRESVDRLQAQSPRQLQQLRTSLEAITEQAAAGYEAELRELRTALAERDQRESETHHMQETMERLRREKRDEELKSVQLREALEELQAKRDAEVAGLRSALEAMRAQVEVLKGAGQIHDSEQLRAEVSIFRLRAEEAEGQLEQLREEMRHMGNSQTTVAQLSDNDMACQTSRGQSLGAEEVGMLKIAVEQLTSRNALFEDELLEWKRKYIQVSQQALAVAMDGRQRQSDLATADVQRQELGARCRLLLAEVDQAHAKETQHIDTERDLLGQLVEAKERLSEAALERESLAETVRDYNARWQLVEADRQKLIQDGIDAKREAEKLTNKVAELRRVVDQQQEYLSEREALCDELSAAKDMAEATCEEARHRIASLESSRDAWWQECSSILRQMAERRKETSEILQEMDSLREEMDQLRAENERLERVTASRDMKEHKELKELTPIKANSQEESRGDTSLAMSSSADSVVAERLKAELQVERKEKERLEDMLQHAFTESTLTIQSLEAKLTDERRRADELTKQLREAPPTTPETPAQPGRRSRSHPQTVTHSMPTPSSKSRPVSAPVSKGKGARGEGQAGKEVVGSKGQRAQRPGGGRREPAMKSGKLARRHTDPIPTSPASRAVPGLRRASDSRLAKVQAPPDHPVSSPVRTRSASLSPSAGALPRLVPPHEGKVASSTSPPPITPSPSPPADRPSALPPSPQPTRSPSMHTASMPALTHQGSQSPSPRAHPPSDPSWGLPHPVSAPHAPHRPSPHHERPQPSPMPNQSPTRAPHFAAPAADHPPELAPPHPSPDPTRPPYRAHHHIPKRLPMPSEEKDEANEASFVGAKDMRFTDIRGEDRTASPKSLVALLDNTPRKAMAAGEGNILLKAKALRHEGPPFTSLNLNLNLRPVPSIPPAPSSLADRELSPDGHQYRHSSPTHEGEHMVLTQREIDVAKREASVAMRESQVLQVKQQLLAERRARVAHSLSPSRSATPVPAPSPQALPRTSPPRAKPPHTNGTMPMPAPEPPPPSAPIAANVVASLPTSSPSLSPRYRPPSPRPSPAVPVPPQALSPTSRPDTGRAGGARDPSRADGGPATPWTQRAAKAVTTITPEQLRRFLQHRQVPLESLQPLRAAYVGDPRGISLQRLSFSPHRLATVERTLAAYNGTGQAGASKGVKGRKLDFKDDEGSSTRSSASTSRTSTSSSTSSSSSNTSSSSSSISTLPTTKVVRRAA